MNSPLPIISYQAEKSLQLSSDCVLAGGGVPANVQQVGLATDLAIFNVALARTGRGIDLGLVPFTTPRTLESSRHSARLS